MWVLFGHGHTGGGKEATGVPIYSRRWRKTLRAELSPSDQLVEAKLHESSEDDKDGLSRCPLVDGYQRRELKRRKAFRMNRRKLKLLFFFLVLFVSVNWMDKVSREEPSPRQGQTAGCDQPAWHLSALTLRETVQNTKSLLVPSLPTSF